MHPCYHLFSQTARTVCLSKYEENPNACSHTCALKTAAVFCLPSYPDALTGVSRCSLPGNPPFGAGLRDVFTVRAARASHQPAAFCPLPSGLLLLPFLALAYWDVCEPL